MSAPDISEKEIRAVEEVLRSPSLSMGPRQEAFEAAFAAYVGVRHSIAVSSGTAGLHLASLAAGVREGDLVVTTPFSFVASANCILYLNAAPIFVDVHPETGNIDTSLAIEAVESIVSGGRQAQRWLPSGTAGPLRAILPVHAFGEPAEMAPLRKLAEAHGISVIEDACEAVGADYEGKPTGGLGDIGVFAFYPNKQMTTGEGGMIVTDNSEWAHLCRSLRNQGRSRSPCWLDHVRIGFNYRLDEMSCALGVTQLSRIDELLAKRERVARWYHERLMDQAWIELPTSLPSTTRRSWFVYVVRLHPRLDRGSVIESLAAAGIPSRSYFAPIHLLPPYQERFSYRPGSFPVAERLGSSSLALPFSGVMTESQVERVSQTLAAVVNQAGLRAGT